VVDNNSSDETRSVVESWRQELSGVSYVFENKQGRSFALNAGINATSGELIGFIDDDEEVEESWYESVYDAFTRGDVDFIGGPISQTGKVNHPTGLPGNSAVSSVIIQPEIGS